MFLPRTPIFNKTAVNQGFYLVFTLLLFVVCGWLSTSSVYAQEVSIQLNAAYSFEDNSRVYVGPQIGWGPKDTLTEAPPPPPPGAFDMRIVPNFFKDIFIYEDSTWYTWDISFQNQAGFDSLKVFFDRCELLNNVREAYIVNQDSSVVFNMVTDSVAVIDPSFNRRFTVWLLSKPTISDDPPQILAQLPDAVLDPNTEIPYRINVSSFFQSASGSPLRFSAQTNTDLVNLVSTQTGIVELTLKEDVEDTTITVLVTAFGAGCGFVEQEFTVNIPAIINLPIEQTKPLPDFELQGNFPTVVLIADLNDYFFDQNETQPEYAISFNASVVSLVLSNNVIIANSVNGVFNTQTNVTITATDGEFSASDTFTISIGEPNRAPIKIAEIPTVTVNPNFGFLQALFFRNYFTDPDNDPIIYTLNYDISKINAGVQGDTLFLASVAGVKNETVEVDLTISDGLLSTTDRFIIRINDNLPPQAINVTDSLVLEAGYTEFIWFNLPEIFTDPENDQLNYSLQLDKQGIADISVVGNQLVIRELEGVENEEVQVILTASDGINSTSISLRLVIKNRNRAPTVTTNTIELIENYAADLVLTIPLKAYFSDPDNDSLAYTITTSSNIILVVTDDSTSTTNATGDLQIDLDADSSLLRIKPLLNTRLDEEILVEATDGEFSVSLVISLNLYPQGVTLPTVGNLNSRKSLYRTFPNPAVVNSTINVVYEVPEISSGELELTEVLVYNILGRFVKRLVLRRQEAGVYSVNFDTRGLASGTYIYTLRTSSGLISRKLTLID
jgi:hypothetical protein